MIEEVYCFSIKRIIIQVQLRTDEARVNFSRNQSISTRENIKLTLQFSAKFPLLHCELFLLSEILQFGIDEKEWLTSTCQELCAVRNLEARVNFSRNQLITSENIYFISKFFR